MIKLDIEILNAISHAQEKTNIRPHLACAHVEDNDGKRTYVATDAQIMFIVETDIPEGSDVLSEPLNIMNYKTQKLSKGEKTIQDCPVINNKIFCAGGSFELSDMQYPNWRCIIPKNLHPAQVYHAVNPDYLKKVHKFIAEKSPETFPDEYICPETGGDEDRQSVLVFEYENRKALLMPLRPWRT